MQMDRRSLIKQAGQFALLGGMASFAAWPVLAAPLGANPFTLGVAAGDPWPDGFVIWTRLATRPLDEHGGMPHKIVPVAWEVSETENFSRVVRRGEALARPEMGHAVHVELSGLSPHRHYWYRFSVSGSDISPVGMARTAPAAHALVDRMRLAVAGCQNYEHGYFDALGHLAQEKDLDLIFHYGDYIYEGAGRPLTSKVVRQHVAGEIYSLDDYRRRHAQYKTDRHLQAAHAACAFAMSFDDHEIDNNWVSDIDQDGTPPEIFTFRKMVGLQAWYENMPVRRAQLPTPGGIHAFRRLDYGRLLRAHVLDTRSFRSDQPCDDGKIQPCPLDAHNGNTVLGGRQEAWLDQGLTNGATWHLLAQQILVMPYKRLNAGSDEPFTSYDIWDGYRPARERLVRSIQKSGLSNAVIASGDFHRNIIGTLPADEANPDGPQVATEFLASSISSNGDGGELPEAQRELLINPHMRMINNLRGYHVHDITPERWQADVRHIDHVQTAGGKISTLATFFTTPQKAAITSA